MYEKELISYGIDKDQISFVNLASNNQYLILNYRNSDRFNIYVFCGLQTHYDKQAQSCVPHQTGFFNLDLPAEFTPKAYRNLEGSPTYYRIKYPTSRGYSTPVYRCEPLADGERFKQQESSAIDLDDLTRQKL